MTRLILAAAMVAAVAVAVYRTRTRRCDTPGRVTVFHGPANRIRDLHQRAQDDAEFWAIIRDAYPPGLAGRILADHDRAEDIKARREDGGTT
jgi:hypothetical protein